MSTVISISTRRRYGVARVCRVWGIAQAGVYQNRVTAEAPPVPRRRPGLQGPMSWHEVVGEFTFADANLDRLVYNAYRIALDGPSLRKIGAGNGRDIRAEVAKCDLLTSPTYRFRLADQAAAATGSR